MRSFLIALFTKYSVFCDMYSVESQPTFRKEHIAFVFMVEEQGKQEIGPKRVIK
jgi:hypothetical protein